MTEREPTAEKEPIAELLFGPEDATPMSTDETTLKPWAQACERLEEQAKYWLATARPDGRPHVMPVLAVWMDGRCTSARAQARARARTLLTTRTASSLSRPMIWMWWSKAKPRR